MDIRKTVDNVFDDLKNKPRTLLVEISIGNDTGRTDEELIAELNSMFYLVEFKLFPLQEDVAVQEAQDFDMAPLADYMKYRNYPGTLEGRRIVLDVSGIRRRLDWIYILGFKFLWVEEGVYEWDGIIPLGYYDGMCEEAKKFIL